MKEQIKERFRKVFVMQPNGEWKHIPFEDLKVEDIVRMQEPDGTMVPMHVSEEGEMFYEAFVTKEPYEDGGLMLVETMRI